MVDDISPQDYDRFKLFLEQACGILLGEGKQYLITSRLTKLLRDENIPSVSALLQAIEILDVTERARKSIESVKIWEK